MLMKSLGSKNLEPFFRVARKSICGTLN